MKSVPPTTVNVIFWDNISLLLRTLLLPPILKGGEFDMSLRTASTFLWTIFLRETLLIIFFISSNATRRNKFVYFCRAKIVIVISRSSYSWERPWLWEITMRWNSKLCTGKLVNCNDVPIDTMDVPLISKQKSHNIIVRYLVRSSTEVFLLHFTDRWPHVTETEIHLLSSTRSKRHQAEQLT